MLLLPQATAALALAGAAAAAQQSLYTQLADQQPQAVFSRPGPAPADALVDALGRQTYEGYEVVRVAVSSMEERMKLVRLGESLNLDIWAHHVSPPSVDILLPPELAKQTTSSSSLVDTPFAGFSLASFIPSLPELISETYSVAGHTLAATTSSHASVAALEAALVEAAKATASSGVETQTNGTIPLTSTFHAVYHPYDGPEGSIKAFMLDLKLAWPDLVEIFALGTSSEGRTIWAMRVGVAPPPPEKKPGGGKDRKKKKKHGKKGGKKASSDQEDEKDASDDVDGDDDATVFKKKDKKKHKHGRNGRKKEFVVQGGQHGREWISPASAMYFAHYLLANCEDSKIRHLLEHLDFTFIPVVNVDGYEYTHKTSRLWRKTRMDTGSTDGCRGIDPNRNWGYKWTDLAPGVSASDDDALKSSQCSESYPGKFAFEAPEVAAVAKYLKSQEIIAFIDVHSYGQLLMFPFSYSCDHFPPDAEDLSEALAGATKALKAQHGTEYQTGEVCELVFRAAGDSVDWAYGEEDIKWSFSMELPDTGTYGFLMPPRSIRPTAEETTAALEYLALFVVRKENGFNKM